MMQQILNNKLEEYHKKQEMTELRKRDQELNYQEQERLRREKIMKVQAKHFGIDAKNQLRKVSMDNTQ